jgi:hypothetical protein
MKEMPWTMKMYEIFYLFDDQEQKIKVQSVSTETAKATFLFLTSENGIDKVIISCDEID